MPHKRPRRRDRGTAQVGGNLTLGGQTRIDAVARKLAIPLALRPEISERRQLHYLGGEQLQMRLRPPRRQSGGSVHE